MGWECYLYPRSALVPGKARRQEAGIQNSHVGYPLPDGSTDASGKAAKTLVTDVSTTETLPACTEGKDSRQQRLSNFGYSLGRREENRNIWWQIRVIF